MVYVGETEAAIARSDSEAAISCIWGRSHCIRPPPKSSGDCFTAFAMTNLAVIARSDSDAAISHLYPLPARERVREGAGVDVFEFTAERDTVGDARGFDLVFRRHLGNIMGRGLAFDGRIGGQNQLLDITGGQPALEQIQPELIRADTIQRRQMAHQYEVLAAKFSRVFDREYVGWRFDDAQHGTVSGGTLADAANIGFTERAAGLTVAYFFDRIDQHMGQVLRAGPVAFEQMKRHTLRRLGPDTGQAFEGINELLQQWRHGFFNYNSPQMNADELG